MAGVNLDETLYYQWLINNNSTSTMLNAISGSTDDSSFNSLSSINALSGLNNYSSIVDISSLSGLSGVGSSGSLDSTGSVSGFSDILQSYLSNMNVTSEADATEAATMADKMEAVLEEAKTSEDTSSLTYQTVQELYDYFCNKSSVKAASLLGSDASTATSGTETANTENVSSQSSYIEQMNKAALNGQEFDFSSIDEQIDNAFAEKMPLS